uniref:Mediator of RNA polymerase II transcription subunit 9 n=1 Tax=Nothobranchius furzeri TaxID=105023 RepID=A0A8C6KLI8_NOTFU
PCTLYSSSADFEDRCCFFKLFLDKDNQDVHAELAKLKAKIQEAREQISNMPGIDSSPLEQQQQLTTLREQVRTKNQLLQKYKGLCMFDVPKPS